MMSWDKEYKKILFLVGLALTVLIVFFEFFSNEYLVFYEKLNLLVIIYTGLVVTWYTKETYDLKHQGIKSLRSSIQPIIIAEKNSPYLLLRNVGRGSAMDIRWKILRGDVAIQSDASLYPAIIESFKGQFESSKVPYYSDYLVYRLAYTGTDGLICVHYQNERGDEYYSEVQLIANERFNLTSTGPRKNRREC